MKKIHFFTLIIFCTTVLFSCKKQEMNIGKDGLDSDAFLDSQAIDTFSLESYMSVEDSLVSDNLPTALLGSYNDPVFGKVESEMYIQFLPSGLSPDFGDLSAIKIDSFVLGMEYKGYYGNLDPQNFEVHQMLEDIYNDSTYYSFQTKLVSGTSLMAAGKNILTPDPITPIKIGDVEVESQLRLYLDTNFARAMINETVNNPSNFLTNENFLAYFKGLNIKVNNPAQASGEGAMLYFNLNDPLSKLTLYYTQAGVAKEFDLLIDSDCADFNHITMTNSAKVQALIDNPSLGQNEFYTQANQSRAVVKFTTIDKIPKNAIIQYAKLELPVSFYNYDAFFPCPTLSVSTKISATDDQLYLLTDDKNKQVLAEYNNFDKNYEIDVRKYIQDIVNGTIENEGIYLSSTKMVTSTERVVFNGVNSNNKEQPKLKIIYTTY